MVLTGMIEAGGTKFVCAVANDHRNIIAQKSFATAEPEITLAQCIEFFQQQSTYLGEINQLGIASFGPLDLNRSSASFGSILKTPKPLWSGINMLEFFSNHLCPRVVIDTDVNGAALAEATWGSAKGVEVCAYVTVGTGIGVGLCVERKTYKGLIHPELGHIMVKRAKDDNAFQGACPFHGDCLEGLASGPAIKARWKQSAEELPTNHPAWSFEAHYIGQLCCAITLAYSPHKIVLGGGVMAQSGLLDRIREEFSSQLSGYLPVSELSGGLDAYIVPQSFGGVSGLVGAFALAQSYDEALPK